MAPLQIVYQSYPPVTGYGLAASANVGALRHLGGYRLRWITREFEGQKSEVRVDDIDHVDANLLHFIPRRLPGLARPDVPNLAISTWETDHLPKHWLPAFERIDRIAVPSTWNQSVFSEALGREIDVVPHISEFHGIRPPVMDLPTTISDDVFVFLTIGSWDARKNVEALVEAYLNAFTDRDDVLLVIKTDRLAFYRRISDLLRWRRPQTTAERLARILRSRRRHPRILLLDQCLPPSAIASLHARADAYVTLTRGEGWGYGSFEAAWFATPVIATGYGGHLDYLGPDLAFLVEYEPTGYRRHPWDHENFSAHRYAEPDRDDAIDKIRFVVEHREAAAERGRRLREFVATHFDDRTSCAKLESFIACSLHRANGRAVPREKYFREVDDGVHYDSRFYIDELDPEGKRVALRALLEEFTRAVESAGVRPILMHGALIGWTWNRRLLPWDHDIDLCVLLEDLETLERRLSAIPYDRSRYLLDINPNFRKRETLNRHHLDKLEKNRIDARFIDRESGLYLDITALGSDGDGHLVTKCPHRYRRADILPSRPDELEGIPVHVPNDVPAVLASEYGATAIERPVFVTWRFDRARGEWRKRPAWVLAIRAAAIAVRRMVFVARDDRTTP